MKLRFKHIVMTFLATVSLFSAGYVFADSSVVSPQDFLMQVFAAIKALGGLSWVMKIASIITLIIASMKVSFLNDLLWAKLGAFKAWAAPVLGLIAGIIMLPHLGLAEVFAYISAGAGAVIFHELLDSIKAIPGLGPVYVTVINLIEGALGGPSAQQIK